MNDSISFLFERSSPLQPESPVDFFDEEILQQVIAESFDEYISQVHGSLDDKAVNKAVENVKRVVCANTK